jgi:hypothetical protein
LSLERNSGGDRRKKHVNPADERLLLAAAATSTSTGKSSSPSVLPRGTDVGLFTPRAIPSFNQSATLRTQEAVSNNRIASSSSSSHQQRLHHEDHPHTRWEYMVNSGPSTRIVTAATTGSAAGAGASASTSAGDNVNNNYLVAPPLFHEMRDLQQPPLFVVSSPSSSHSYSSSKLAVQMNPTGRGTNSSSISPSSSLRMVGTASTINDDPAAHAARARDAIGRGGRDNNNASTWTTYPEHRYSLQPQIHPQHYSLQGNLTQPQRQHPISSTSAAAAARRDDYTPIQQQKRRRTILLQQHEVSLLAQNTEPIHSDEGEWDLEPRPIEDMLADDLSGRSRK